MESWRLFCLALEEANNTEFYGQTFPEFRERIQKQSYEEILTDEVYKALESGLDPTDCLKDFLRTILGSASRYSMEMDDLIPIVIQLFLDKGAKFPYEKLFESQCQYNPDGRYDEDEIQDYHVRGFIIDYLKPECAKQYADWSRIDAMYWEDIPAGVIGDYFRFSYLKYCSKYLQSL
jgi:hypothetical protein